MAPHPEISEDLRRLLGVTLDSFEKLEVLALACRQRTVWTVVTASEELRLPARQVEAALHALAADGFLTYDRDNGYQFEPRSRSLTRVAEELCALYDEERVVVLNLMTGAALERIRSSVATTFADAFRFRGKKRDDGGENG